MLLVAVENICSGDANELMFSGRIGFTKEGASRRVVPPYPNGFTEMKSDSTNWNALRIGDKIRIVQIPSLFSDPHYENGDWDDTFALYRRLISSNEVLTISGIDELGRPWVEYETQDADGGTTSNSLAVDDDSWVRAEK